MNISGSGYAGVIFPFRHDSNVSEEKAVNSAGQNFRAQLPGEEGPIRGVEREQARVRNDFRAWLPGEESGA